MPPALLWLYQTPPSSSSRLRICLSILSLSHCHTGPLSPTAAFPANPSVFECLSYFSPCPELVFVLLLQPLRICWALLSPSALRYYPVWGAARGASAVWGAGLQPRFWRRVVHCANPPFASGALWRLQSLLLVEKPKG